ncbi:ATP-binding protein [Amycolatopsis sp. RTGN1]|uniref:ATP-binding protein n=1 Tax=Amycolatopsis ponsaeliensis TaxID=2992142 RepID=UPI00254B73F7|nr:ATP-binding protein [Amycolatopsis sp. RTGN1]
MPPTSEQENGATDRRAARPFRVGAAPATLRLILAADWIAPSVARSRLRDWLEAHSWPANEVHDLVLAISEAVSNSVEHGYGIYSDSPGAHSEQVEVTAWLKRPAVGARHVELTVRDSGGWREPRPGPIPRGHGLNLMRAASLVLEVEKSAEGTQIRLTSRPVADRSAPPRLPGEQ